MYFIWCVGSSQETFRKSSVARNLHMTHTHAQLGGCKWSMHTLFRRLFILKKNHFGPTSHCSDLLWIPTSHLKSETILCVTLTLTITLTPALQNGYRCFSDQRDVGLVGCRSNGRILMMTCHGPAVLAFQEQCLRPLLKEHRLRMASITFFWEPIKAALQDRTQPANN